MSTEIRITYHSWANEVLNSGLDLLHVNSSGEIEILVEKVAVPVLLGAPPSGPHRPRRVVHARLVSKHLRSVQPRLVRRQCLLSHHVSHQNDEVFVGDFLRSGPNLSDLVVKPFGGRIGQQVLGLPTLCRWLQKRQEAVRGPIFHGLEDLSLLWGHFHAVTVI